MKWKGQTMLAPAIHDADVEQTRVYRVVRRDSNTFTTLVLATSRELALANEGSHVAASQAVHDSEILECVELVPAAEPTPAP